MKDARIEKLAKGLINYSCSLKKGEKVLSIIDAKHNGYYVCGYENDKVILPPEYIDGQKLTELLTEYKGLSFCEINGFEIQVVDLCEGLIKAIESKKRDSFESLFWCARRESNPHALASTGT